jgi:lipid-binding SYLF domain-containing protein
MLAFAVATLAPTDLGAQDRDADAKVKNVDKSDQAERAMEAAEVLREVMEIPEKGIPDELMGRAVAVAVIPNVVKGALGFGGSWGKGLVSHRGADGKWSAPAYINLGGGSFGLQLGVEATDVVLVFIHDDGFEGLLDGKVKLGADASVAAGPVGRKAEVGTDVMLKSAVFSYSRSKGLFAGISLDGSAVTIDDSANEKVYGKKLTGHDILLRNTVRANDVVAPFLNTLEMYTRPAKRTSQR